MWAGVLILGARVRGGCTSPRHHVYSPPPFSHPEAGLLDRKTGGGEKPFGMTGGGREEDLGLELKKARSPLLLPLGKKSTDGAQGRGELFWGQGSCPFFFPFSVV
jgi:hypothetical protein